MSWKDKADKLQTAIKSDPSLGVQVVYRSREGLNDDPVCVPELVSESMQENQYPDVVTAPPADMVNPKYQWYGAKHGWYENDTQAQGSRISKLEDNAKKINDSVAALQKDNSTAAQNAKIADTKMDQLVKLVTATNANVGQIMTALNKSAAQSTTPEKGSNK